MTRLTLHVLPAALLLAACGGPAGDTPKAEVAQAAPTSASKEAAAVAQAPGKAGTAAGKAEGANEEGCLHEEKHEEGSCEGKAEGASPAADAVGHFGGAFELASAEPLSKVLAAGEAPKGPVRVRGTVEAVCQKKGCWMEITDGSAHARILVSEHAFALPSGARGKIAEVEGTVEVRELTEAQVKHVEKDAGRDPSMAEGTRNEYVITARAVELAAKS